jgi:hypothetical protein
MIWLSVSVLRQKTPRKKRILYPFFFHINLSNTLYESSTLCYTSIRVYSLLLELSPCLFEWWRIWQAQKRRLSRLHWDNRLFRVPAGIMSNRYKKCIPLFRPTVQWEMAKSLIARKDRGSARVVQIIKSLLKPFSCLNCCLGRPFPLDYQTTEYRQIRTETVAVPS